LETSRHITPLAQGFRATSLGNSRENLFLPLSPFLFSLSPQSQIEGYQIASDRFHISFFGSPGGKKAKVKLEANEDLTAWERVDPFTFGFYRVMESDLSLLDRHTSTVTSYKPQQHLRIRQMGHIH
jgi:hypothetical protein